QSVGCRGPPSGPAPRGRFVRPPCIRRPMASDTSSIPSAEATRLDADRILGSILDIAADAIITIDEAQRILIFNQGAEEIFGYSRDEVVGQPLDILIPERFRRSHHGVHLPAFAASADRARRMGERREIYGLRK